ncbi:MAG: DUF4230 domain-containing protein [Bacteroidetes bacterium]|nr:DUF4230 domain-containing protein [Bacteroidota bacterium]
MNKGNFIWALLIVGLFLGFLLGKWIGKRDITNIYTDNPEMVKQIAELSVLEVQGTSRLNQSNTDLNKSVWSDISDFFGERTLQLEVPYTAKYGVDLAKSDLKLKKTASRTLEITMEKPALRSFEMRLDKMQQFTKNGMFVFQKDDRMKLPVQKLYAETREKLSKHDDHLRECRNKIESVLSDYFKPLEVTVKIRWVN